jgi:hypothetical protein
LDAVISQWSHMQSTCSHQIERKRMLRKWILNKGEDDATEADRATRYVYVRQKLVFCKV